MKKLLSIAAIIIAVLYLLDGIEYTEAEKEWCKEHRPLLPIKICAKEFGYQMKKLIQDAFFKECVVKLGSIYILLVVLGYIFFEYRSGQGMSWANGFVFAIHDKIAFSIFSLILIVFSYGLYSWIKAFFRFVFMVQISIRIKILRVFYLVTAPIIARLIVSEIFALFQIFPCTLIVIQVKKYLRLQTLYPYNESKR